VDEFVFDTNAISFAHQGKIYPHQAGCGWHVYLKLAVYDCGE
jgi:hypothetical protein